LNSALATITRNWHSRRWLVVALACVVLVAMLVLGLFAMAGHDDAWTTENVEAWVKLVSRHRLAATEGDAEKTASTREDTRQFLKTHPAFFRELRASIREAWKKQDAELRGRFDEHTRGAGLKIIATARDGECVAELWQMKAENGELDAVVVVRPESDRFVIEGGASRTAYSLVHGGGGIEGREASGEHWRMGDRFPFPSLGSTVFRPTFHIEEAPSLPFAITVSLGEG